MAERVAVYIDGFNLYFGLRAAQLHRFRWLDPARLADNLLKPGQSLEAVKYFTARISGTNTAKLQRQATYLDAISADGRTEIIYGRYMKKQSTCRTCGAAWPRWEEKMTDVNIATHLTNDAHRNVIDVALVISGDSDLALAFELVRQSTNKRIVAVFPPKRGSRDLIHAVDAHFSLGRTIIGRSLLPDPVLTFDGRSLACPPSWH